MLWPQVPAPSWVPEKYGLREKVRVREFLRKHFRGRRELEWERQGREEEEAGEGVSQARPVELQPDPAGELWRVGCVSGGLPGTETPPANHCWGGGGAEPKPWPL